MCFAYLSVDQTILPNTISYRSCQGLNVLKAPQCEWYTDKEIYTGKWVFGVIKIKIETKEKYGNRMVTAKQGLTADIADYCLLPNAPAINTASRLDIISFTLKPT